MRCGIEDLESYRGDQARDGAHAVAAAVKIMFSSSPRIKKSMNVDTLHENDISRSFSISISTFRLQAS